jgi:hypothetical protein
VSLIFKDLPTSLEAAVSCWCNDRLAKTKAYKSGLVKGKRADKLLSKKQEDSMLLVTMQWERWIHVFAGHSRQENFVATAEAVA